MENIVEIEEQEIILDPDAPETIEIDGQVILLEWMR